MNKLQQAIDHLNELYSTTDNLLYHSHSRESLAKKLAEIQDSVSYLESMRECPVIFDGQPRYCTLQGLEQGNKFITPFDPAKDTEESIVKLTDGTVAYKFLAHHQSIPDAQIAIYGRPYPFP